MENGTQGMLNIRICDVMYTALQVFIGNVLVHIVP